MGVWQPYRGVHDRHNRARVPETRAAGLEAVVTEDRSASETTGRRLVYFAAERTLMA